VHITEMLESPISERLENHAEQTTLLDRDASLNSNSAAFVPPSAIINSLQITTKEPSKFDIV